MGSRVARVVGTLFGTAALAAGGSLFATGVAAANQQSNNFLRVGCGNSSFSTIGAAVAAARPRATVFVCPGTYDEDVVIQTPLTLIGQAATINATGLGGAPIGSVLGQAPYNGITIESSNVTVTGFTVEGAQGEGILAINPTPVAGPIVGGMQSYTGTPLTHITIDNNVVENNNTGFNNPSSPYGFCTPNGGSDCGEGIHLLSVADSQVINNKSVDNAGGILLTDEFGPNHDNLIEGNYVEGNAKDCGITVPSHNAGLNPATGQPNPSFAGDYRNRIIGNRVIGNGVTGFGAGIGIFAPGPFTASYDNVVSGNYIQGNGLAGISVHSHAPNAYVNGNVFTNNTIGTNNVTLTDGADPPGPIDNQTTGILIWSAVTNYTFVVANNNIFGNTYGIWLTPSTVNAVGLKTNRIVGATTPIFDAP